MFRTKVPRVFVWAGLILTILILNASYYLNDAVPYRPSATSQSGLVAHLASSAQEPHEVLSKSTTGGDVDIGVSGAAEPDAALAHVVTAEQPVVNNQPEIPVSDHQPEPEVPNQGDHGYQPGKCQPELELLKKSHSEHRFTDRVRYTRRCILPRFSSTVDRNVVANISGDLVANSVTLDIEQCNGVDLPQCDPITLAVPLPYPRADFPHLIFGISTEYDRLCGLLESFTHWLSGTGPKLVALVSDIDARTDNEVADLEQKFRDAGIDISIVSPLDDSHTISQSHFAVLLHMLDYSSADTRWFGLIDDDTFFPSLTPLSDALDRLDHNTDAYVGALSEDFSSVRTFGFMAFGGAGVYLSPPLAEKLGGQVINCIDGADRAEGGDSIIRNCVYSNSKAKLTILPGLYQQDLREDASGFFESGVKAINFHHWKSWYREPVVKMSAAATYCGDCFLQRWRFGTDTLFSNGYSIATYRNGVEGLKLEMMEGTWRNANEDFDFSIGPLRSKLEPDEKKTYKLTDVAVSEGGDLRQLYVWKGSGEAGEMDEIVELVWQKP